MLEVCTDSIAGVLECIRGGAGRVELASALSEGGITPSSGEHLMAEAVSACWHTSMTPPVCVSPSPLPSLHMHSHASPLWDTCNTPLCITGRFNICCTGFIKRAVALAPADLPIYVLIRPRGGDFLYEEDEILVMEADVKMAGVLGAAGVVIGCLSCDGSVDEAATKRLLTVARQSVRSSQLGPYLPPSLSYTYTCSFPHMHTHTHIHTHAHIGHRRAWMSLSTARSTCATAWAPP
jgi:hypothetical protein